MFTMPWGILSINVNWHLLANVFVCYSASRLYISNDKVLGDANILSEVQESNTSFLLHNTCIRKYCMNK